MKPDLRLTGSKKSPTQLVFLIPSSTVHYTRPCNSHLCFPYQRISWPSSSNQSMYHSNLGHLKSVHCQKKSTSSQLVNISSSCFQNISFGLMSMILLLSFLGMSTTPCHSNFSREYCDIRHQWGLQNQACFTALFTLFPDFTYKATEVSRTRVHTQSNGFWYLAMGYVQKEYGTLVVRADCERPEFVRVWFPLCSLI